MPDNALGWNFEIDAIRTTVIAPSPTPIIEWKIIIEGKVRLSQPENAGATSMLHNKAPIITESQEAKKTKGTKRL